MQLSIFEEEKILLSENNLYILGSVLPPYLTLSVLTNKVWHEDVWKKNPDHTATRHENWALFGSSK